MIDLLNDIVRNELPGLLVDRENWDSLIVNRRKPATYRVFCQRDDLRICLHRFDPCHMSESFAHPHPWPAAFLILDGQYRMSVGFSATRTSPPEPVIEHVMGSWSSYSITHPMTWHAVTPLETTYTVMVNRAAWPVDVAHTDVRTTKGKDLDKMPESELHEHLKKFQSLLINYLSGAKR